MTIILWSLFKTAKYLNTWNCVQKTNCSPSSFIDKYNVTISYELWNICLELPSGATITSGPGQVSPDKLTLIYTANVVSFCSSPSGETWWVMAFSKARCLRSNPGGDSWHGFSSHITKKGWLLHVAHHDCHLLKSKRPCATIWGTPDKLSLGQNWSSSSHPKSWRYWCLQAHG